MDVISVLLIGLLAGAIATVVFTVVEYLDIAVTGRPRSLIPGQVAVAMTGGNPHAEQSRKRVEKLNLPTHLMHGTALGLVLALVSLLGLGAVLTTIVFYGLLLGGDWMLYSALGVTSPTQWNGTQWTREMVLKAIFAAVMGVAFYWLIGVV